MTTLAAAMALFAQPLEIVAGGGVGVRREADGESDRGGRDGERLADGGDLHEGPPYGRSGRYDAPS